MPDKETMIDVRFPDGHSERWNQTDYDQYKDDLYKEYQDAKVTRYTPYNPENDTDASNSDQFQISFSDGHSEVWGRKDFDTYKGDLMKVDPNAQILKASDMSLQYWGSKAEESGARLNELRENNKDFIRQYEQSERLADALTQDGVKNSDYHDFVTSNKEKYDDLVSRREDLRRQYYTNPLVVKAFQDNAAAAVKTRDEYDSKAASAATGDERRDWKRAAKLQDDIRKLYEAPSKYSDELDSNNGFIDYIKDYSAGAVDTFSDKDFYTLGLSKIARNFDLRGIAEKLQGAATANGQVTAEDIDRILTPGEKAEIQSFYQLAAAQEQRADNISSAYNAGGSFAESVKFMAEFLASQGLANVAGKAMSASSNALASWLGRQLMSERALNSAISKGVTAATKGTKAALFAEDYLARPVIQGLFHTATQLSSLEGIADGLLDTDSNGKLVSVGQAVSKGILDQVVENWSESFGGAIEKTLALPFKGLGWAGERTIANTGFGRWARWIYNSDPVQLFKEAGFNGMISEIGEEWAGNAVRVGLGLMSKDEFKDFASWEKQLEMAASFAPLSIIGLGTSTTAAVRRSGRLKSLSGQVQGILEKQGRSQEEIDDLFNTRFDTAEDVAKKLAPYLKGISEKAAAKGATEQDKADYKTVMEFAQELSVQGIAEEMENLRQADRRKELKDNIESSIGTFWRDTEETGEDGNPVRTQTVRVVTDVDGASYYVTGEDEQGLVGISTANGKKRFINPEDIESDTTSSLEEYLQGRVDAMDSDAEAQRMEADRQEQIAAVQAAVAANPVIPIGTPEAPVNATVVAANNTGVQIAWEEDGQQKTDTLSWGQVAANLGTPIVVKTDAELEADAADELDAARGRMETYRRITPGTDMTVMLPTGEGDQTEPVTYKFEKAVLEDGRVMFYGQDEQGKSTAFTEEMIGNLDELVGSAAEETTPFKSGESVTYTDDSGNKVTGTVSSEDNGGGYTSVVLPDGSTSNVQTARLSESEGESEEKAPAVAKYTDESGKVNQNAFITNEPEEWAKWNDEQNQDGGADSQEALTAAISELDASLKEEEARRKSTSNPDERSTIKENIANLSARRERLQAIIDGYSAKEEVMEAAGTPVVEETPAPVAEEKAEPAQEEAVPQTPEQVLGEIFTDINQRLREAKTPEEREALMQEKRQALENYYALTTTDPTVVGTRADILQRMEELGFSERVRGQVRDQLNAEGTLTEGFHIGGMVFIVADDIRDARRARLAHLHEHWHEVNRKQGYQNAVASMPGVTTEYLLDTANKMAGVSDKNGYGDYLDYPNPQQALADEVIALSMEVISESTPENVDENLRNKGLDNQEIINFVKTIYNGERGNGQTLDSSGRDTLSGDNAQEGQRKDGRNSASQPEGNLGEQGSGSGERGIQGAGEGGLDTSGDREVTPPLTPFVKEGDKLTSYIDAPTGQKSPSAPDETMFSLKREEDSKDDEGKTVPGLRTLADGFLAKLTEKPLTPEELAIGSDAIKEMVDYMMPYLDMVKDGKRYLPEEIFGKGWSTIFKNGSYGRTMENTLICMRTLAYNDFVNAVQEKVGRPLTPTESFLASQMLYDIATDPQCLYCYVALDRKAYNGFLKTYIEQRDAVLDKYKADDSIDKTYRLPAQAKSRKNRKALPADNKVNKLYLEYLDGRADTPSMRNRFNGWLDRIAEGTLIGMKDLTSPETRQKVAGKGASYAAQIDDAEKYAQSASWAKKQEEYRAYNGELLSMPQKVVNLLNSEYGLRFYSFSEYSPAFIVENMQMVRDAALRGLVGLAYTKEIDFAKIFAPTGININISCYGREAEDGTVVMDTKQGADWGEAQTLRERYGNVGCVFVATNDRMVEWAIHQPWVDVVIPFHIVRTGEDIAKFYDWTNYTAMEADKDVKGRSRDIMPTEHMNDKDTFLRLCEERGLKPRFADLILPSTGRSVTEDPDYMKLVNETRRSVNETVRIKPIFDTQEARRSFDEFVDKGGYYAGWFTEEGAFERGVEQVAADVEAGKTAKDVDYGRQDIKASAEKLAAMAGKKKRPRSHQGTPRRIGGDKITKAQQNVLNYLETGEFKSEREPLEVANATQKQPVSDAAQPVVTEEDVMDVAMFRLSKNNRQTVESWIGKREDLTEEQRREVVDYIDKLDDAKTQLATARWFANGTIRIPEDMKKVQQAISVSGKAKVDPLKYKSPMELLDAHAEFKPSEERINPDEVSTLHRAAEYPEGIVVYDVDDTEESRKNMRDIINSHFGEDASPWCLLQGDGKGKLTADSKRYWRHYNAYPKQVAFKDGKLLAFSANDTHTRVWWDRQDEMHYGIPVTKKVEGDALGRSGNYILSENPDVTDTPGEFSLEVGSHLFKGNRQNGLYEEWNAAGDRILERTNYKNGKEEGLSEVWYPNNGQMERRCTYKDGNYVGTYEAWFDNGRPRVYTELDDEGRNNGVKRVWNREGILQSEGTYDHGKRVGDFSQWDDDGNLLSVMRYDADGDLTVIEEHDEFGIRQRRTYFGEDGQVLERFSRRGQLLSVERTEGGKLNGLQEQYYMDGTPDSRVEYTNGERNGLFEKYHPNGQLWIRGQFKDGKKDGVHESWSRDGVLNTRTVFKDDEVVEGSSLDALRFRKAFDSAKEDLGGERVSVDNPDLMREYGLSNVTMTKKGNLVTLNKVVVADQKKGNGTRFMNDLTSEADNNGWTLALTPDDSFGATSVGRLKKFYKRFGFKENKGRNADLTVNESMIRQPEAPRFRLSNREEMDREYMAAVEAGDMDTAQRMVDEAAVAAGFTTRGYHQTNSKRYVNKETGQDWDTLDWNEREEWETRDDWDEHWEERDFYTFDRRNARTSIEMPAYFFAPEEDPYHEYGDRTIDAYLKLTNPVINPEIENAGVTNDAGEVAMRKYIAEGYDGFIREEDGQAYEYGVFDASQIKSAEPVTYDDEGNVVPLSKRFDLGNDDIRFRKVQPIVDESNEELFDAAKKRFGTTRKLSEAGYVLPDGAMLDFSGRHLLGKGQDGSWLNDRRTIDHREIQDLNYLEDLNTPSGIETDMSDFIRRGAIRLNTGIINLATKPTKGQENVLWTLISRANGNVDVDFGDGYDSDHYASYDNARPERILNDIRRYFDEGVNPEGNVMFSKRTIETEDGETISYESMGGLPIEAGRVSLAERTYKKSGVFSFTGSDKVVSSADVAYIFKELENSATENSFLVFVKNGKPTILHTGMGDIKSTTIDFSAMVAGLKDFAPDEIYMVHNHPSGKVEASRADWKLITTLQKMAGKIPVQGVIIDTYTGEYGIFSNEDLEEGFGLTLALTDEREHKATEDVPLEVLTFDQMVYNSDYRSSLGKDTIRGAQDVAAFLSAHRLGEGEKVGALLLNKANVVVGNLIFNDNVLTSDNAESLARDAVDAAVRSGAEDIILYGDMSADRKTVMAFKDGVDRLGGGDIKWLDAIKVDGNHTRSLAEGTLMDSAGETLRIDPSFIGRELNKDEIDEVIRAINSIASGLPEEIPFTKENYDALFAEGTDTPIGHVKMSENQFTKFSEKGREWQLAMADETLRTPAIIIEKASEAKEGQETERPSSYIFVKTFDNPEGKGKKKIIYYNSITAKRDGLEIVMSNYDTNRNRVKADIEKGKLTYVNSVALSSEAGTSVQGDQFAVPAGDDSSTNKDTNSSDNSNSILKDSAPEYGDAPVMFRKVTDPDTLERLESEPTIKVYRAMQEIDGKLYPPMAAKVEGRMQEPIELGVWEEAVERPELADAKGNFTLNKGNGKSLKARYNPYIHTSRSPLNDQFTSAYDRPNLVTVEVEVPESELTSGYKAEKAKDPVGEMTWHSGPVSGKLPKEKSRKVILTRWDKPVRVVPDSEVAERIAELLEGENIAVPYNVVTPSLREALIEKGVEISGEPSGKVREDAGQVRFRKSQDMVKQSRESGLAGMIGDEDTTELYLNVYRAVPKEIRDRIISRAGDSYIFSDATRDIISEAVEKGDETGIAGLASNMLRDYLGDLDERTARYILWRGTRKAADDDLIDTVNDIAMQRRLQVGEFAEQPMFRKSPVTEEEDRAFREAEKRGDKEAAARLVEEAARKSGYNTPKLYHGTDAFGFTSISNKAADDGLSFWATNKEEVAGSYTKLAITRRPGTEIDSEEYDRAYEKADTALDEEISNFRRLIDKYFSEWYFGQSGNSGIRKKIMDANHERGYGDGVYDVLEDYVVEAYAHYGEDYEGYEDFADWEENSPEAQEIFDSISSLEGLRNQLWQLENGELSGGVYELYANSDNMFVVDAEGKRWNELHPEGLPKIERGQYKDVPYKTRDVVKWAKENGYDGVIFKNIRDNGQYGRTEPSDVYAFLKPKTQVKSAEPFTYDDKGKLIPLSERFNPDNDDIRFRLADNIEEHQGRADSMADDAKATMDEKKEDARENDALTTVKAMSLQKEYDRKTVNAITVLARNIIKDQNIDTLNRREIARLLGIITTSVGKAPKTVKKNADALMGLVVDHLLRSEETKLGILTSRKASKVNAAGVEVQGELDVRGQNILKAYKAGLDMEIDNPNDETDENTINGRLAILSERLSGNDDALRSEAEDEYAGLMLAKEYLENVKASVNEERGIRNEIRAAEEDLHAGKMSRKDFNEFIEEANNSIRENKVERIGAYRDLASKMRDMMAGSIEARKAFTEREKARVEEIHHLANSDMQGRSASPFRESTRLGRLANSSIVRFFAKPLATFDQMLRLFGGKNVAGEGYLWNKFHRGWIEADENAYLGEREAKSELDAKVSEVFGKEMRWSDLYAEERKMPTVPVKWWDDGEMREHELTQGNLLYIYMVNKMTDGRMKLRRMGITQDIVDRIARQMDSRFIELADWLQSEYLVQKRNKYNAVHERLFGASMAAIEDYFPLKINKRSLNRAEDIGRPEFDDALPATTTGSIIKRKRNAQDLDLANADAFSVVIEHVEQMEQWAAFAEFNKDLNTLLSYKRFRNQVQNMASVYGSGRELWNNFKSVCRIAGGTYNPAGKKSDLDTAALNIAKGVTAAKISFRVYTALKQFLSMPAFVSDANIKYLAGNIATPWKAWNWAMENLPMFEKRWMSRMAGDTRLMKTESDWKLWRNNIVEKLSRWGMSPNGFVDALTVSIGSHSIYQSRYDRYIKDGYTEEQADKKAKQDATTLYNETQQSNEAAFVAPVQLDRTVLSTMLTVFRNSSMGYQRQLHDAIRNIGKMLRPGYKSESVEFMKLQMIRDGLTEEQAEHAANRNYNREIWRSAARVGTFGFLVQFAWNLGGSIAYLLFGDDDDKKEEMLKEAAIHGLIGGSMEGLAGGNVMSEALNMVAKGESLRNYDPSLLPIVSDLKSTYKKMSYDPVAGANDLVNLAIQAGIGVNPQTLTDAVVAVVDACGGDLDTSKEAMLLIMRVLQVPQSQVDQIYIDELDMTAGKARTMSPGQMAERYARYKVAKGAPLTGWAYSDEAEEKREKAYLKSFNKKVKERKSE